MANRERQRLGLGDQPIPNIRSLLESDVGVRIFFARLPRMFAGMYIFVDGLGGCMLINSVHPADKQRASIAHEYAHLIVDRYTAGIDYLTISGRKPANERFAESFAMSFLMPASSVRFRFNEIVNTTGNFQVGDLVKLKHRYSVSMEAMALRLESPGTAQDRHVGAAEGEGAARPRGGEAARPGDRNQPGTGLPRALQVPRRPRLRARRTEREGTGQLPALRHLGSPPGDPGVDAQRGGGRRRACPPDAGRFRGFLTGGSLLRHGPEPRLCRPSSSTPAEP